MVGGDPIVLESVRPVLSAIADRIYHVGPNGAGSTMKLIVNLIIGTTVLVEAEAVTLGREAGLDPHQMRGDSRRYRS